MSALLCQFLVALAVGALLMLALSFTVYRQSYYYKRAMAEAGRAAARPGLRSRLVTVAILVVMILLVALFDLWISSAQSRSFALLAALNLAMVALLSAFDALFIDYLLLVAWRPAILALPEGYPTRESMRRHMRMQFTAGWLFKVPIAIVAAALASLFVRLL